MDAFGHKADKSKVNIGAMLSANGTEFYFDYQNGQYGFNTDPERGANTFHPFKSGEKLIDFKNYLGAINNGSTITISEECYITGMVGNSGGSKNLYINDKQCFLGYSNESYNTGIGFVKLHVFAGDKIANATGYALSMFGVRDNTGKIVDFTNCIANAVTSYTMQEDGYITGILGGYGNGQILRINNQIVSRCDSNEGWNSGTGTFDLHVQNGDVISVTNSFSFTVWGLKDLS